ncbi:MAG: Gfo/Idh/MocA family oxidoreductase, partial [Candidatus Hydrogenedentota bacterium]
MRFGMVGCGNIGADLCIAFGKETIPAELCALTDVDPERAKVLVRSFQLESTICDLDEN